MAKSLHDSLAEENLKSTSTIGTLRWEVELEVVIDKATVQASFSSEDCICQIELWFFFFPDPMFKAPIIVYRYLVQLLKSYTLSVSVLMCKKKVRV